MAAKLYGIRYTVQNIYIVIYNISYPKTRAQLIYQKYEHSNAAAGQWHPVSYKQRHVYMKGIQIYIYKGFKKNF